MIRRFLYCLINQRATNLIVRGLAITTVNKDRLIFGNGAVVTTAVTSLLVLIHGQHRHLQHGMRQQGSKPFYRIHQCTISTKGITTMLTSLLRKHFICSRHIAGHDMILNKTLQRVDTIGEVFKLPTFLQVISCRFIIHLYTILHTITKDRVVNLAGQIIECIEITL